MIRCCGALEPRKSISDAGKESRAGSRSRPEGADQGAGDGGLSKKSRGRRGPTPVASGGGLMWGRGATSGSLRGASGVQSPVQRRRVHVPEGPEPTLRPKPVPLDPDQGLLGSTPKAGPGTQPEGPGGFVDRGIGQPGVDDLHPNGVDQAPPESFPGRGDPELPPQEAPQSLQCGKRVVHVPFEGASHHCNRKPVVLQLQDRSARTVTSQRARSIAGGECADLSPRSVDLASLTARAPRYSEPSPPWPGSSPSPAWPRMSLWARRRRELIRMNPQASCWS